MNLDRGSHQLKSGVVDLYVYNNGMLGIQLNTTQSCQPVMAGYRGRVGENSAWMMEDAVERQDWLLGSAAKPSTAVQWV